MNDEKMDNLYVSIMDLDFYVMDLRLAKTHENRRRAVVAIDRELDIVKRLLEEEARKSWERG